MRATGPDRHRSFGEPTTGAPVGAVKTGTSPLRRTMVALAVTAVALTLTATLVHGLMGAGTPANAATAATAAAAATTGPDGTVQTKYGPLTAADRDLVIRVRWAGLWEAPTGLQAQQRAASPIVKEIGLKMMNEHMQLDAAVRTAAVQLGMGLPNEPNPDQKSWMAELSKLNGDAYDKKFVERLRVAHGKVYKILADVRSTTQNSVVRSLAATGMTFVQRHMSYLESTGLTNYAEVAAAVEAPTITPPVKKVTDAGWPTRYADKIILVALLLAGAVNFLIFRRSRRKWADLA